MYVAVVTVGETKTEDPGVLIKYRGEGMSTVVIEGKLTWLCALHHCGR